MEEMIIPVIKFNLKLVVFPIVEDGWTIKIILMIRLSLKNLRLFSTQHHMTNVSTLYNEMVSTGKIRADLNQIAVTKVLDEWTDGFYEHQNRIS